MSGNSFRTEVEGLRAIAVLAVVGYHAFPTLIPGGFIGVDIFFVISGYLVSKNIFNDLDNKCFSIVNFYSRRIRRILPALLLVLLFVLSVGWIYMLPSEYREIGKHVVGAITFSENILYFFSDDYFDKNSLTKPLLQLWSLAVEEQFYLFWPLLLLALHSLKINYHLVLITIIIISFIASVWGGISTSKESFFLIQFRIWELAIGSLLALPALHISKSSVFQSVFCFLSTHGRYIGLGFILLGLCLIKSDSWFPGFWALLPVVGAFLVIFGNPRPTIDKLFLTNRLLTWFGQISYPLYLWHWILLSLAFIIFPDEYTRSNRIILVVISIFVSWLTFKFIESFFRSPDYFTKKLIFLFAIAFIIFLTGLSVYCNNGYSSRPVAQHYATVDAATQDWQFPKGGDSLHINNESYIGTSSRTPEIAFIGDSHADQYAPRIFELYKQAKFKESIFITLNGCPPIPNVIEIKHPKCSTFTSKIDLILNSLPSIRTIVVAGCWNCYFLLETRSTPDHNNFNYAYRLNGQDIFFRNGSGSRLALESLEIYLSALATRYKVFLVLDNHMSPENDPRFYMRNRLSTKHHSIFQKGIHLDKEQLALNIKMNEVARRAGVQVIDPLHSLCPEQRCAVFSAPGIPIFKDSHHLRSSFVIEHAAFIDQAQQ